MEYSKVQPINIKPRLFRNWYVLLIIKGYYFETSVFHSSEGIPMPVDSNYCYYYGPFFTKSGAEDCANDKYDKLMADLYRG